MGDFQRLLVWQASQDLAVDVYRLSASFPMSERFGLTSQIRRAAVSVSSNIAEGAGRGGSRAFCGFIRIARGSLHELRSQIHLAVSLDMASAEAARPVLEQAEEVSRMLSGILRAQNSS